jgi:hypothetical protein
VDDIYKIVYHLAANESSIEENLEVRIIEIPTEILINNEVIVSKEVYQIIEVPTQIYFEGENQQIVC